MSGLIPQHFIDELIGRTDIVEVIGRRVPLRRAGREFSACCPFHEEKTPSFTVSPVKQFYHCFGCGAHGTALGFLMEHDHMGFVEAVEELAAAAGLEVPREAARDGPDAGLYELMERAAGLYGEALSSNPQAQRYLEERGIDAETAARFRLGYAPEAWDTVLRALGRDEPGIARLTEAGLVIARRGDHEEQRRYDRFRGRLMFPIRDARGRVIAFGGRVLGQGTEREPKYLNSPETPLFQKGRELYGLYEMRLALREIPRILVVEGYMDVLALAQHGIAYSVATLGTATTTEHLGKLFRVSDEIVFCFDGDRAGRAAAWRALRNALPLVQDGRSLRFLFVPDGHDPDTLVREEGAERFEARLAESQPLADFLIEQLRSGLDLDGIDGRARLAERARPLLHNLPPSVYRELLIDRLAQSVGLSQQRLDPLIGQPDAGPAPRARAPAPQRNVRDSLVRRAVRLVLNNPAAAAEVEDTGALDELDLPGIPLLVGLLEDARAHPHITTAGLVERWRDHALGRHLAKLAGEPLLLGERETGRELAELLRRLHQREGPARRRAQLLASARQRELSDAEKAELQRLLQDRAGGGAPALPDQ